MAYFTESELFKAYRKAKNDAFYDKDDFSAAAFLKYEQRLEANVRRLAARLNDPSKEWIHDLKFIGTHSFVPKQLEAPHVSGERAIHFATLDPLRDWERQCNGQGSPIKASFRQVMLPSVDYKVVSALWLIKVGEKYDRSLDKSLTYAHNLRRVGKNGPVALDAPSLFVPYISGYKAWRENGLQAMRGALEAGKSIVAMTMDVQRFYHQVAPNFMVRKEFIARAGVELTPEELAFTEDFIASINRWYESTPDYKTRPEGAIPVGLSASRVISNVLLAEFDEVVSSRLNAIYYGRYADDIFLVVKAPEAIASGEQFIRWVRKRLEGWLVLAPEVDGSGLRLQLRYARDSDILFSSKKQKIFFLSGEHGLDLLDHIADKIEEQSSQFRKLPELPSTESKMAARALLATPDARLEADSLRKAEGVSLRRFGFSMLLSDVEAYARDLDPADWVQVRAKFYGLVKRYVLVPSGYFDYVSYTVRVFGLMVACRDYKAAEDLIRHLEEVADLLRRTTSVKKVHASEFRCSLEHYYRGFLQVALQASTVRGFRVSKPFLKLLSYLSASKSYRNAHGVRELSAGLLKSDLGRRPYYDYWFEERRVERRQPPLPKDFSVRRVVAITKRFRSKIIGMRAPYWPAIAFPTRPVPIWSLCLTAPNLMAEQGGMEDVIRATRGAQVNPWFPNFRFIEPGGPGVSVTHVPSRGKGIRRFGVPSFLAKESDWLKALGGKPGLTVERYTRTHRLVNRMLRDDSRLEYIAFPECSLPLRWALPIAQKLASRGISLIAGIENRGPKGRYTNDALVSLATSYFGSGFGLCFLQPKMELAVHEAVACKDLTFVQPNASAARPIYVHGGFCFGVLICSDLTNISNRSHYQGAVDALFVLEWNQDLSTFEFLVESSAHDLHAAVIQVNNRQYGDSRIRVPYSEGFRRDVVQVRGGDSDFYVTASIDFAELRAFQRGSGDGDLFKPLPIGYVMSSYRRLSKKF